MSGVANEILEIDSSLLDPTTCKLRSMCKDELTHLKDTGCFQAVPSESGSFCYTLIKAVSRLCFAETQAIEGLNSQIKLVSKRCPNISLELLASRLLVKRTIASFGSGHSSAETSLMKRKKWSLIKPFAESKVAQLSEHMTSSLSILADVNRWATADTVAFETDGADDSQNCICNGLKNTDLVAISTVRGMDPPTEAVAAPPQPAMHHGEAPMGFGFESVTPEQIAWAKQYNVVWKRFVAPNKRQIKKIPIEKRVSKASLSVALVQQSDGGLPECFLVTETFGHSVQFSRLRVDSQANCVHWVYHETNCVESTLFFMSFFNVCTKAFKQFAVTHCTVGPDLCAMLFAASGAPLDVLMNTAVDVCKLEASGPPNQLPGAGRGQGRGRGRGRGQGRTTGKGRGGRQGGRGRGRSSQSLAVTNKNATGGGDDDNMNQSNENGSDNDNLSDSEDHTDVHRQACLREWLENQLNWEDDSVTGSDQSGTGLGDSDDDNGADRAEIIKTAQEAGSLPSAEKILERAAELEMAAESNIAIPEAELREEALLLLLRQSQETRLQVGPQASGTSSTSSKPKLPTTEIAGPALSDDEDDIPTSSVQREIEHYDYEGMVCSVDHAATGVILKMCISKWMCSTWKTLECLKLFADHSDKPYGHNRSIALVLLKPVDDRTLQTCRCVRCSANDDSFQLIYVHWLNNSEKYLGFGMRWP